MKQQFYIVLFVIFCSCNFQKDESLIRALELAGENRQELKNVLLHYNNDSLKLKAATFLIENMSQYYSVSKAEDIKLNDLYDQHEAISLKYGWQRPKGWQQEIDSLTDANRLLYTVSSKRERDIEYIKADWLIKQIDLAFLAWKKNSYTRNLPFETFCEFILPYRFKNSILLDDSRQRNYEAYGSLFQDSSRTFIKAVDSLLYLYKDVYFNYYHGASIPIYSVQALEKIKYGQCNDKSWHNSLLLASVGMAVCTDFVPARGNRNNAHTWNTIIVNNESYPFEPFWNEDKWNYKIIYNNKAYDKAWGKFRLPKVFRQTFSINTEGPLSNSKISKANIPPLFQNQRITDVSYQYFDTTNIKIQIPDSIASLFPYAYLCVYGYRSWIPIQWGEIIDKYACFNGMGRDIVYIAGVYMNGSILPMSDPFYLAQDGSITYYRPNGNKGEILTRAIGCFLETEEKMNSLNPILGSTFVGINESKGIRDTLHTITEYTDVWENNVYVADNHKYKHIDVLMPTDTFAFCEISIFQKEKGGDKLMPDVKLETPLISVNRDECSDMLLDNFSATGIVGICKSKKEVVNRVRFTLPQACDISKISYIPYTKSMMKMDCNYRLYFWDKGWHLGGEQRGNGSYVLFKDIPLGTLYRLENDSYQPQKNMERIFIYEDGIIRWM